MISFPHAKINLGLSIVSKRPDGFHNLETIFYPVPIRDVLEIVPAKDFRFNQTGISIPGITGDNLVLRAYQLLKKNYPQIGPLEIHLYKSIPLGAGLGGGSSDAAQMLRLLKQYYNLPVSLEEMTGYARELGSDCPFFLQSAACFAKGRGEILEPVILDLSGYSFLLVHPEIHIETGWAFSKINPAPSKHALKESIVQPVQEWYKTMFNDFELPVFRAYPALQKIKEQLYSAGALYAAMTGSGSTIFGIFPKHTLPGIQVEYTRQTLIG